MSHYLETLHHLEPSYVIRKFLDAQRIHNLASYLERLHTSNLAAPDHTTLLLNCYTKLQASIQISEFVESDQQLAASPFHAETAVKVLRGAGFHS